MMCQSSVYSTLPAARKTSQKLMITSINTSTGVTEHVSDSTDEAPDAFATEVRNDGLSPATLAAVGSVALALYYYYVRGEKQRGQFVGLWPATILGLAIHLKLDEIKRLLQQIEN